MLQSTTTYPRWRSISSSTNFEISFRYTHRMDFKQRQKHNEIYQKVTKKLLQRQNITSQINSRFTPTTNLKREHLFHPKFYNTKRNF